MTNTVERLELLNLMETLRERLQVTVRASADWQQRAERAEGHLRLLGSLFGTLWKSNCENVGHWGPGGLEACIAGILEQQQADNQQQEGNES